MAFKLKELYDELGEVVENVGDILGEKVLEESENEYKISCTTCYYYLPELNINVHYSNLLIYEPEEQDYMIADSIFLVFNRDTKELVYSEEGGTIHTCIHNYLSLILKDKTVTMEKVENLDCTYMLDRGAMLDSYKCPDT